MQELRHLPCPPPPGDTVLSSVPHRTKGRGRTEPRLPGFITAYGWSPKTICSAVTGPFPGSPCVHGRLRTPCSPAEPLGAGPKPAVLQMTRERERRGPACADLLPHAPGWPTHCLTTGPCDFRLIVTTAYTLPILW